MSALFVAAAVMAQAPSNAQDKVWTLRECLDYAMENNIQLQQQRNTYESSLEDTRSAKGAFLPSVSAGVSQGLTEYVTLGGDPHYSGSYNLSADMTLYNGGKLRNAYRKSIVQNSIDSLSVEESANDIRLAIVEAYMQCLYSKESIVVNEGNVESSKAQMDRAEQLWKAGSISKVDYAQLQSQYQSDEYQLVVAKNSYESSKLTLKQLLELDILDEIEVSDVDATEDEVLALIPSKAEVFEAAKDYMPQMTRGGQQVRSAEYAIAQAKAGYLPSLSLSAGTGTANSSFNAFGSQLADNLNANVGLSLRIPIFSQNQNRTAVRKAEIAYDNSVLQAASIEKSLLKDVETTYLDVISAQSQYISAKQKLDYAQASYDLTFEQFGVGYKNTVELITAQNELASAKQSVVLAKYTSLRNLKVLDIYQGK